MKQKISVLYNLVAFCVIFACFYLISPKRFHHNNVLYLSSAILVISLTNFSFNVGYLYRRDKLKSFGNLASLGIRLRMSLAAMIIGAASFVFAWSKINSAAEVCALAAALSIASLYFVSTRVATNVELISAEINFPSQHLAWSDELVIIANMTNDFKQRQILQDLSEDAKTLSREVKGATDSLDSEIDSLIQSLRIQGNELELGKIQEIEKALNQRFSDREIAIKAHRRNL